QVGAIAMASANRDLVETWGVPELWEDGLASGRAAKFIGRLMGLGRREAENLFVAGLFSSAGAAALASDDPGYLAWRAKQWSRGVSESQLLSRERMAFQSDHVTAAGRILESWNMPTMIVDAVASHHSPVTTFQKAVAAGMAVTDPFSPARCLDTSFPAAMRRLDLAAHTNSVSSEALRYVDALSPAGDRLLAGI
ncbi:MAG: HDOD domain-containing protein, partial [Acidimicrobiia bacterium]|nr:HDOD domain-containing protein [Acidimicrobiia bacterium]